jgi:tryptophan halogenase
MLGQHILPRSYHPAVDLIPERELNELVGGVRKVIASCVEVMPMHAQFLARYGEAARQQP